MNSKQLFKNVIEYKTVALSTSILSEKDYNELRILGRARSCGMIMGRDTGVFVKLYYDTDLNRYEWLSDELHKIFDQALEAGYQMIEFDVSA